MGTFFINIQECLGNEQWNFFLYHFFKDNYSVFSDQHKSNIFSALQDRFLSVFQTGQQYSKLIRKYEKLRANSLEARILEIEMVFE